MLIQSKITAEYGKLTLNVLVLVIGFLVLVVGFDSDHKKLPCL